MMIIKNGLCFLHFALTLLFVYAYVEEKESKNARIGYLFFVLICGLTAITLLY